jgi:hypothetical protein
VLLRPRGASSVDPPKRIAVPECPVPGTGRGSGEWPELADLSRSHHSREPMSPIDPERSDDLSQ